jgi:betaine-homocysteine S-methyltransferase
VICAEGYVFELERRGYCRPARSSRGRARASGGRDAAPSRFRARGSDVVEALTYYAHREKLRVIGRESDLEPINRRALEIAKAVATETGALFRRRHLQHQRLRSARSGVAQGRARDVRGTGRLGATAGVDYIVGETFSWAQEALIALDVILKAKKTAVITLAMHKADVTREDGRSPTLPAPGRCGRDVVGLNCIRGPETMLPLAARDSHRREDASGGAAGSYRRREGAVVPVAVRHPLALSDEDAGRSRGARSVHLQSLRDRQFGRDAMALDIRYLGVCCGAGPTTSARWPSRSASTRPRAVFRRTCRSTPSSARTSGSSKCRRITPAALTGLR